MIKIIIQTVRGEILEKGMYENVSFETPQGIVMIDNVVDEISGIINTGEVKLLKDDEETISQILKGNYMVSHKEVTLVVAPAAFESE